MMHPFLVTTDSSGLRDDREALAVEDSQLPLWHYQHHQHPRLLTADYDRWYGETRHDLCVHIIRC